MFVLLPKRGWAVGTLMNAGNEMDLPGNPSAMDRTSRNAVDALLGEPVEGGSLRTFYIVFDLVVLALVGLALLALYRAVRSLRRREPPRRFPLAWIAVAARAGAGNPLLLGPLLLGLGWGGAFLWTPDVALTLLVLGALLVAAALTRMAWLVSLRAQIG